jgi:hypothetical protein
MLTQEAPRRTGTRESLAQLVLSRTSDRVGLKSEFTVPRKDETRFQRFTLGRDHEPRALPWAGMSGAFSAESSSGEFFPSAQALAASRGQE